jgi:serine protease Do
MPTISRRPVLAVKSLTVVAAMAFCCNSRLPAEVSARRRTPIVAAVEAARPAVVNIHGHKTVDSPDENGEYGEGPRRVNGMGTGVVIDERGYIITNHHVIDGVRRINVTLADRRTYTARLIARDPQTDLAVIKIKPSQPLKLIKIGSSSDLMPGEPVVAVGNAYGYHHTVTRGIISALDRTVEVTDSQKYFDLIQTDASINPGNSGGPLLNIDGEMIGINVAVRVGAQGIGFAIPVDKAIEVAAKLMRVERTSGTWHGFIGETVIREGKRLLMVHGVREGSPAESAGVQPGDVVLSLGSRPVERPLDIERALLGVAAGTEVLVKFQRDQNTGETRVLLARAPNLPLEEEDEVWALLGLRLSPVEAQDVRNADSRYKGGLRVAAVREDSPAARRGMRVGDILVGMHVWETVSMENMDYILNHADLPAEDTVRFYVVRGTKTHVGQMPVLWR